MLAKMRQSAVAKPGRNSVFCVSVIRNSDKRILNTLMRSVRLTLLGLVLVVTAANASQELFPKPEELVPDVDFWLAVFTDYSVDEGVLHDNRNLGVVYERLAMPAELSRRERQRRVATRRKSLQAVLRSLASGKREQLTAEEAHVLALWPDDVSNETLADAATRIRYQQGLRERFREGLQRSGRWRDYVNEQFTALGVPVEIAALPHVESSYNPAARSHIGASGIWQFTRSTGRRFMRVDHVVDERNDPFAATRAAGQLMAYNYSLTGNWPMAITAYNHGLGGVRRAMRQFGDTAYVDILRNYKGRSFGFASRNFYVAFLAAREVDRNAERYFPGLTYDKPVDYALAELPAYVPADALARSLGVTPAQLAQHNPALQPTIWQGSKYLPKGYEVRLPTSVLRQPMPALVASVPRDSVFTSQLPDLFHTVARGDTLSQIAVAYKTRVSTLVTLNNLGSRHRIRAGQRLRLPAAGPAPPAVIVAAAKPAKPAPIVVASTEPASEPAGTALLSDPSDYSVGDDSTIEVQPLETLGHFGDWLQIKTQRLRDINGLAFGRPVEVGQRIRLDLGKVGAAEFEQRRIEYHRRQQDEYFRRHVITSMEQHTIRRGESIWVLSLRRYGVPFWLFRQYNPTVDVHNVTPGTVVQFPVLRDVEV